MPLTHEFIEEMRAALLARRKELVKRQLLTTQEIAHLRASDDGIHDSLDTTMLEQETGALVQFKERELHVIRDIDDALERIKNGSYGFCEDTGDEISEERLRANPTARVSVEAQADREAEQRRRNFRPGMFDDM